MTSDAASGRVQRPARSRTAQVIDHLLSRGPFLVPSVGVAAGTGADPWTSTMAVLRTTTTSILAWHLAWLAARTEGDDDVRGPDRISLEDQMRILVRALEERHQDDAVQRALEQRPGGGDIADATDDLLCYASALDGASAGQPDASPYVALADSATLVAADVLYHRSSSAPPPSV